MTYNHISNEQFDRLKMTLGVLGKTIQEKYSSMMYLTSRADDPETLSLNYSFIESGPYESNFAIFFEDKAGPSTFKVGVLKSIDIGSVRYFKRKAIAEGISIENVEQHLSNYISSALILYEEWNKSELLNGERISIEKY